MQDESITLGELAIVLAIFVGPFLLAGAVAQFILLRKAHLNAWSMSAFLLLGAFLTLILTWALMWVVPPLPMNSHGAYFPMPALVAAAAVTVMLAFYARRRAAA